MNTKRMQHIGIVAPTAEGAAYCYRAVVQADQAALGVDRYPEVSLHGFALAEYLPNRNARNWAGVGDLLLESARKLAAIGADFIIMPCHTMFDDLTQEQHLGY